MKRLRGWIGLALRDLRGDLRRFGILIACLALGTAVIAAVGSVGAGLKAAVIRDATALMGGDLEASRPDRGATPEELAFLESLGSVTPVVDTNVRAVGPTDNALVDLVAVGDNYPLIGNVASPQLTAGQKPAPLLTLTDGAYGAIVDVLLLERLGVGIGGRFRIAETEFEVRGILTALPDGAIRGFRLGLTTMISIAALGTLSDLRPPLPGLLTSHGYKIVLDGRDFGEAAAAIAAKFKDADWQVRSPRDAVGDLARYFDLFTRFLLIVGLSSLLVGAVGVSTGVTSYIGERQRSIATMRAMGATGSRILVHFLAQVGVLALCGVGIGVLAGAASSAVALPFVGQAVGVNLPVAIDVPALLTAAAFGLLAAFAFSYPPLVSARRVSPSLMFRSLGTSMPKLPASEMVRFGSIAPVVLAACGIYLLAVLTTSDVMLVNAYAAGVVLAFVVLRASGWLLQFVLRYIPRLRANSLRYALRNIDRPGSVAPVVVLSIGLGLAMVLVIALLNANLRNQLLGTITGDAPTLVASELFEDEIATLEEMAKTDPRLLAFHWSPSVRTRVTKVNGVDASSLANLGQEAAFLLGIDIPVSWLKESPGDGNVVDGTWWPADYDGPPLISLRSTMRNELGLKIGDTLEFDFFGDKVEGTIANFREYQYQNGMNFPVIFSPGLIEYYPSTFIGSIKAAPGFEKEIEAEMTDMFPDVGFLPIGDALAQAVTALGQLATGVNIVGGLAVINGLLVLAGTMAAGRKQRESDAVVHKVLGAERADVLWIFALEYGILAAFAAAIASLIGAVAAWAITENALDIAFGADPVVILTVVAGAVVLTVLAGAITTWRSLSKRPAQFLRTTG